MRESTTSALKVQTSNDIRSLSRASLTDMFGPFGLLLVLLVVGLVAGSSSSKTLVLKKFQIDEQRGTVQIAGRLPGIIAWILAQLGLDDTTTLDVDPMHIRFRQASLFGSKTTLVTTMNVSTSASGLKKPVGFLIAAGLTVVSGLLLYLFFSRDIFYGMGMQMFMADFFVALVLVVLYALNKKLSISIETTGGLMLGLSFKRSIIEGIPVDIARCNAAIHVIHRNMLNYAAGHAPTPPRPNSMTPPPAPMAPPPLP